MPKNRTPDTRPYLERIAMPRRKDTWAKVMARFWDKGEPPARRRTKAQEPGRGWGRYWVPGEEK